MKTKNRIAVLTIVLITGLTNVTISQSEKTNLQEIDIC